MASRIIPGALQFGSRLRKSLPSVALAATTLVGGAAVLSGGQAQALNCTFGPGGAPGANGILACNYGAKWNGAAGSPIPAGPLPPAIGGNPYGQWLDTNIDYSGTPYYYPTDKEVNFVSGPSAGTGEISFDWLDVNNNGTWRIPPDPHSIDQWPLNVIFNAPLLGAKSIFKYKVRITEPGYIFEDVTLQSQILGSASVTKDVYSVLSDGSMGYLIGSIINGGSLNLSHWNEVFIVDTADATAPGSSITSYQNVFRQQVPGPLPLLGAGAAFGFTRKLRRRVKTFQMA